MKTYSYALEGSGANDQTFTVTGAVEAKWADVFDRCMLDGFGKLTRGRAQYGKPGVGCNGPYAMKRLVIEEIPR